MNVGILTKSRLKYNFNLIFVLKNTILEKNPAGGGIFKKIFDFF